MTLETYGELRVGDEIHLTQKYRNWLVESMFDMHTVRDNIKKGDYSLVRCAIQAADMCTKITVTQLLDDVGMDDPGIRATIDYPDGSVGISILSYKSAYKKRS